MPDRLFLAGQRPSSSAAATKPESLVWYAEEQLGSVGRRIQADLPHPGITAVCEA
jgi:hypothetical protein